MTSEIIKAKIKDEKERLKFYRKKEHNKFYKEYKPLFILLDVLVLFCLMFNFGALVLTNILVSEQKYIVAESTGVAVKYYEANDAQGSVNNFETVESIGLTEKELIKERANILRMWGILLKQAFLWAFLLWAYVINRTRIYNHYQMGILIFAVSFYFSLLGYDYWHDFGLYLGMVLFG